MIAKNNDGDIVVAGVFANSAADKSGILVEDIIKKVNDKLTAQAKELGLIGSAIQYLAEELVIS